MLEQIGEKDKRQANTLSHTMAHIASALFTFMGSKDVDFDSFLPFPSKPSDALSDTTLTILYNLIKSDKLPNQVIYLLNDKIFNQLTSKYGS
jgi:hypothetical protein